MNQHLDLEKLEPVQFEIAPEALAPKVLHCGVCNAKMEPTALEVPFDDFLYLRVEGFECAKCKKSYVGLAEAQKFDRAMMLRRAFQRDFTMERSLSFDGDNYTFRIPKEFTRKVQKRKIEIIPLGAKEFCATVE